MASLSWPWEPLEPSERIRCCGRMDNCIRYALPGSDFCGQCQDARAYDPYAEQDKAPSERAYDEMNRDIEPQMETWRAEG